MKIAVIGAGGWGKYIVKTLHSLNALGAIVDCSNELKATYAEQYPDIPFTTDADSILKDDSITAVAIATPAFDHYERIKAALKAGKDVYVEKPITLDVGEAEELVALAKKCDKILMVGHLLLYQPAVHWIDEYIASGKLGKIYSFYQDRLNLGRVRIKENVLWCLGVHDVAVVLHFTKQMPKKIRTIGMCALQSDIEDDVYLHLGFDGIEAHVHSSWLWPESRRELTVVGSNGMLVYDELNQTVTLHRKTADNELNIQNEGSELIFEGSGLPLTLEMEHFIECIKERKTPMTDGESALNVLRILEEATEQLVEHRKV